MSREGKVYRENVVIFGKVQCTHCGINTDLLHVEMSVVDSIRPWNSWDTIICKDCLHNLPSYEEEETV
jgi:hypothetical protein